MKERSDLRSIKNNKLRSNRDVKTLALLVLIGLVLAVWQPVADGGQYCRFAVEFATRLNWTKA